MNKEKETTTCGICGSEMVHNVPRLGPAGGFVHKLTGKFACPDLTEKEYPKNDVYYLKFEEALKTGWDLYITPEFTLINTKPVNWFNRKMQELILGFKWKRQKNS